MVSNLPDVVVLVLSLVVYLAAFLQVSYLLSASNMESFKQVVIKTSVLVVTQLMTFLKRSVGAKASNSIRGLYDRRKRERASCEGSTNQKAE